MYIYLSTDRYLYRYLSIPEGGLLELIAHAAANHGGPHIYMYVYTYIYIYMYLSIDLCLYLFISM